MDESEGNPVDWPMPVKPDSKQRSKHREVKSEPIHQVIAFYCLWIAKAFSIFMCFASICYPVLAFTSARNVNTRLDDSFLLRSLPMQRQSAQIDEGFVIITILLSAISFCYWYSMIFVFSHVQNSRHSDRHGGSSIKTRIT